MNRDEIMWIIGGLAVGLVIAVIAFRRKYRMLARKEMRRSGDVRQTPPLALPRYIGFGEYYDPFAIWPYGPTSNYQLFLATNSGVPTSQTVSPGYRSAATAPPSSIFGGNGSGGRG